MCTPGKRSVLLHASSIHTRNHLAYFPWCAYSISLRPVKRASPNEVPLAKDLQPALEQLRGRREKEDRDREGAGGAPGDMSENEDGILLIPEGEAGVCRCRTGGIDVASSSLVAPRVDEELSDGEWELPSHVLPIRLGVSNGFKPAPASMLPPIIHPHTIGLHGVGGGMMSPSGTMIIQPTARPPPPPGACGE